METTRVDICYRPLRIAWAIHSEDHEAFRDAVRFTHTLWGGRFNPIVMVDRREEAEAIVELFRADVIIPVGESEQVNEFAKRFPHLITPFFPNTFKEMREATSAQVLDIRNALDSWRDTPEWKAIDEKGVRRFVWDDDDPLRDSLLLQYGAYPAEDGGIPYPVILSQASTVIDCRVENGADPRASVRITRGAGSGQHLASILQEGRENANIDAGLGFIWRISVERETPVKRSDQDANNRFALHRRGMLLATAATFFPIHGASGETGSRNAQPDVGSNAAPAVPIPAIPSLGTGKD